MAGSASKVRMAFKDPKLRAAPDLPEGDAWTIALAVLDARTANDLVSLVRTLCPHDRLPDRVYRRVVVAIDRLATVSAEVLEMVAGLLGDLDRQMPLPFAERSESYRVRSLRELEGVPAFTFLQRAAVRFLYDDVEVWSAFGYEGASVHLGGYLDRGFDDLDWLPPLPPEFGRTGEDPA